MCVISLNSRFFIGLIISRAVIHSKSEESKLVICCGMLLDLGISKYNSTDFPSLSHRFQ